MGIQPETPRVSISDSRPMPRQRLLIGQRRPASRDTMRNPADGRVAGLGWAAFLTFLAIGPWLLPGFIFATDFAGPRIYHFPNAFASYAGIQTVTAFLGLVIPADIVGKILISGLLVAEGVSAFLAVPVPGFVPRAAASTVYLFNPFVYDRLAYGQLNVIGGYAVLPWAASSLRSMLLEPKWQRAVIAAVALALVGILDLHLMFAALLFSAALTLSHVTANRRNSA